MAVELPSLQDLQRAGEAMRAKMQLATESAPSASRRASTSTQGKTGRAAVKQAANTASKKRRRSVLDDIPGPNEVDELAPTPQGGSVEPEADEVRPAKKPRKTYSKKKEKSSAVKKGAVSAGEEVQSNQQGRSTTPRRRSASVASERIYSLTEDETRPLDNLLSTLSKRTSQNKPKASTSKSVEPPRSANGKFVPKSASAAPESQASSSKAKGKRKSSSPASDQDQDPDDTFAHIPIDKPTKPSSTKGKGKGKAVGSKGKEKDAVTDVDESTVPKAKKKAKKRPSAAPQVDVSAEDAPAAKGPPKKKRKSVATKEKDVEAAEADAEQTVAEPPNKKKKKAPTPAPVETAPTVEKSKTKANKKAAEKVPAAKKLTAKAKQAAKKPFVPPVTLPALSAAPFSMQATQSRSVSPPRASTSKLLSKLPAVFPSSEESSSSEEEANAIKAVSKKKPAVNSRVPKKGKESGRAMSELVVEEIPLEASEELPAQAEPIPEVQVDSPPRHISTQPDQPQMEFPELDVEPIKRVHQSDEEMDNMPQDIPDVLTPRAPSAPVVEQRSKSPKVRANPSPRPASPAIPQIVHPARSPSPVVAPQINSTSDSGMQTSRAPSIASAAQTTMVPQLPIFSFPSVPDNINFEERLQTAEGRQGAAQMLQASNEMMREMTRLQAVYQAGLRAFLGFSASSPTQNAAPIPNHVLQPSSSAQQRSTSPAQSLAPATAPVSQGSLFPNLPAAIAQRPPSPAVPSRQPSPAVSERQLSPSDAITAAKEQNQSDPVPAFQQDVQDVSMEAIPVTRQTHSPVAEEDSQLNPPSRILVPETSQPVPHTQVSVEAGPLADSSQPFFTARNGRQSTSPEPNEQQLQDQADVQRSVSPTFRQSPSVQIEQESAPSSAQIPRRSLAHGPATSSAKKPITAPSPVEAKFGPVTPAISKLASGAASSSEEDSDESDSAAERTKSASRRLSSLPLPHLPSEKKAKDKPTASPIEDDDAQIQALIKGGRPRISLADIPLSSPPPSDHDSSDPELEGHQTPDMVLSSREPSPATRRRLRQLEKARAASISESDHDSDRDVPQPESDSEDEAIKSTSLLPGHEADDFAESAEAEAAEDQANEYDKFHAEDIDPLAQEEESMEKRTSRIDSDAEMANADTVLDAKDDADAVMKETEQEEDQVQVAGSDTSQEHAEDTLAASSTSSDSMKEASQSKVAERRASSEISEGIEEPAEEEDEEAPAAREVDSAPEATVIKQPTPVSRNIFAAPMPPLPTPSLQRTALPPAQQPVQNRSPSPEADRSRAQSYSVYGAEGKEIASYFAGTPSRGQSRERMPTPALMGDDEQTLAAAREAARGFEDSQAMHNGIESSQIVNGFLTGYNKQFRDEPETISSSIGGKAKVVSPQPSGDGKIAPEQPTLRAISAQPGPTKQAKKPLVDSQTDELASSQPAPAESSSPIEDSQIDELESSFALPIKQADDEDPSPPATRVHFRSSPTPAPDLGGEDEDEESDEEEVREKQEVELPRMSRQSTADSSNEIQMSLTGAKATGGLTRAVVPEVVTDPEQTEEETFVEENTQAPLIDNPSPLFAESSDSSEEEEQASQTPRPLPRLGGFDMSQASVRPQPRHTRSGSNGYQTSSVRSQPRLSQLGDAKLRQQRKLELARSHSQSSISSMTLHVKPKGNRPRPEVESSASSSSDDDSEEEQEAQQVNIAGKRKPKKTGKNIWK